MTGGFSFRIVSKRVQYEFQVNRKIMRITGNSATGKSELIRTLEDAEDPRTGISVQCKYRCDILSNRFFRIIKEDIAVICEKIKQHDSQGFEDAMRDYLSRYDQVLFFADEDFLDMGTNEFALFCKFTDSFFVLLCREPLAKLPYSYTEIYTIKTSGKFHTLRPKYESGKFMALEEGRKILVEDSNAGFGFFRYFYQNVLSANGKSKIKGIVEKTCEPMEIIADGAAFGAEIEEILGIISRNNTDVKLFLPESFEYLLLSSTLFSDAEVTDIIADPIQKINGLYFSWERFFYEKLVEFTKDFVNQYSKRTLNECYYLPCCSRKHPRCNMSFMEQKKEAVLGGYFRKKENL